ncbi:zinc finger BED domain-containing protein RICESLEEPER 2-like [Prosopis cineraria]|uniref:zinc finger BED domain-containing protein RICESLEEPER 2-like n=1 Tax=Prosopis cineraria TaxID=364024 RepID=UPI00240F3E62|nr:zinc finger BED domain-containing protein RICESLEEPER 2-like [Prosopis cineraria]
MDNTSSNDTALGYLKRRLRSWKGLICGGDYLQLRCCGHVLNLVVNEGIKHMKDSFEAIQSAVRYVRSSPSRFLKFKNWVESEKKTKSLVCLDVSTRWNSTYLMLQAAMKFQKVFERMRDEDDDYIAFFNSKQEEGVFSGPILDDWKNAKVFIKFLKIFYDITLKFSSSLIVTSNDCFHQIARVQKMLQKHIGNSGNTFLADMSFKMYMKFDKYWGQADNMNPLLIVAVILDPRYKLVYANHMFELLFSNPEECALMMDKVKTCLYRLFDEYSVGISTESGPTYVSNASTSSLPSLDDDDDDDIKDPGAMWLESLKKRTSMDPQSELDRYLATDSRAEISSSDSEFDILSWWKANSEKYKILSHMARDVLAMPVSTVASESAFSTGGRVVDQYRSSLSPKMIEALIYGQNWLQSGQSLSELVNKLHEFDNFNEIENIILLTNVTLGGENATASVD